NKAVKDEAKKYLEALRRALDKADGLDVIFKKYITEKNGKYIVFTANAEHMHEIISNTNDWFSAIDTAPHIYSVYSDDPEASSDFAEFKADNSDHLKLLFCIDMLNEGVHVDDISGVILFRPTVSPIVYKQQIGRALSAGKTKSPLILDIVANINSLSSVDSINLEMSDTLQYFRERGKTDKIVNESFAIYDEVCDCLELFNKLEGVLSSSWDEMFECLVAYKNDFGNVDVPNTYKTADGLGLGGWCSFQRKIRKGLSAGILTDERIKKLCEIGFSWNPVDEQWENGFAHAKEFEMANGYLDVPINHICEDNFKLGAWIVHQKAALKNGTIGQERYEKLCEIGLEWDHDKFIWKRNYKLCYEYFQKNNNLDIPTDYVSENGVAIGIWLKSIKSRKSAAKSRYKPLTKEQETQLEAIGFSFENGHDLKWNNAYEVAKTYYCDNHTINISSNYVTKDNFKLGAWLNRQRLINAGIEHGFMTEAHKKLLDSLDFDWTLRERIDTWNDYFESCKNFKIKNPDRQIPVKFVDSTGKKLGAWVANQKRSAKLEKLSKERAEMLNSIGIILEDVKATWWKNGYVHAKRYYEKNNNLSPPTLYRDEEDYPVGEWIRTQIKLNRSGKITA
ncbi:MAG: Helicase associated domain protein, partial [Christensenellaceae bacterium]